MAFFNVVEYDPAKDAENQRDLYTQMVISVLLGLTAFLSFCVLRPRWATLYAARQRQKRAASSLPELPDTLLGWIPALYKITEREVLHSAGLDAYVFLAFFRLAIIFLTIAFLLILVIKIPIQYYFRGTAPMLPQSNAGYEYFDVFGYGKQHGFEESRRLGLTEEKPSKPYPPGYFWMHAIFIYVFTAVLFYLIARETTKIIEIRQEYLGNQSTITDRTIRLAGIPPRLQSEKELKNFIEKLGIGKVESIILCKNWSELDRLMALRATTLRKLETAWAEYLGQDRVKKSRDSVPVVQPRAPEPLPDQAEDEGARLLNQEDGDNGHEGLRGKQRPKARIRYGFLLLQSRKVDAIDYYEEKLHRLDNKIEAIRQQEFEPMPLAFVTMDSIAACQMAVQAILDPSPLRLIARIAPAPSDIVWANTYLSRSRRMTRAWSITILVGILTVTWSLLLVPIAALLDIKSIKKVFPGLEPVLQQHLILRSLVQTGLPTLVLSLLNIAVPYLYDWLSNMQGMISQTEVELSVISKNFFFTFFNLFILFTVLGSVANISPLLKESLHDIGYIAHLLATKLEKYGQFYTNLILLQGVGLFPFKLLEFGSISLYPISLMGAKTPRDFAELVQPPIFKYGFYLPQTLLIFIVCIVYSVLQAGVSILFFGLLYFIIGYFTYKYQLLYAMDHNQHSTGRAWPIICYRSILGVGVFQVAMFGWLAFKGAYTPSAAVVPLIFCTIWFSYFYAHTYEPLTKFIALSSIRRRSSARPGADDDGDDDDEQLLDNVWREHRRGTETSTVDEERERGLTFSNPNLVAPLENVWIAKKPSSSSPDDNDDDDDDDTRQQIQRRHHETLGDDDRV